MIEESQNHSRVQNEPVNWKRTAEIIGLEFGVSASTVKRWGKIAEAYERIQAKEPELPRLEAIKKAKEYLSAQRTAKVCHPIPHLDGLLAKRWEKFIKDIPSDKHESVWDWLDAKRKREAAA
jgi:hypothetical protein